MRMNTPAPLMILMKRKERARRMYCLLLSDGLGKVLGLESERLSLARRLCSDSALDQLAVSESS